MSDAVVDNAPLGVLKTLINERKEYIQACLRQSFLLDIDTYILLSRTYEIPECHETNDGGSNPTLAHSLTHD